MFQTVSSLFTAFVFFCFFQHANVLGFFYIFLAQKKKFCTHTRYYMGESFVEGLTSARQHWETYIENRRQVDKTLLKKDANACFLRYGARMPT